MPRRDAYGLALIAFGALCYVSGMFHELSMRNPGALALVLAMVVGWLALLWLGGETR